MPESQKRPDTGVGPNSQLCADGKVRGRRPRMPERKCLTPECDMMFGAPDKPGGRGLCWKCHQAASLLIKRGATTWAELEELGLAQPKYGSLFERALNIKRREKSNDRSGA